MRDHDDGTESTVSRDGITVYQTYQEERFGVPTVVLKFVSERDGPAEVGVTVDLPPDLHIEEVGFHPDYRREDWAVESDRLEFSTEIGPDEEVTTMYAVESLADGQLSSLLDNLTIERVAGEAAGKASDSGTDSGFEPHPARRSEHTTGGESAENVSVDDLKAQVETYPAADDEAATADGVDFGEPPADPADVPAGDGDTAPESVETDAGTETEDGDGDGDETAGAAEDDEPLDALGLAEIGDDEDGDEAAGEETADASEDEKASGETDTEETDADETADEEAGVDGEEKADADADEKATEETDVAVEATEEEDAAVTPGRAALSDYSTAELVAELDERVQDDGFTDDDRDRLYELLLGESDGATVSDELRVAHLQKRVSDLEASVEPLNEFDDRHGSPAEAFADLAEEVAALSERVEAVDDEASAAADRVGEVEPRLDDIEDDLDSLADEQAELESEVSALAEWRERVRSTLSALGDR